MKEAIQYAKVQYTNYSIDIRYNSEAHSCILLDINECENSRNLCNGTCENTLGSYNCFCPTGYVPSPKETLCIGKMNQIFYGIQIILLQILMNVVREYMTVVGMLFVLTLLEGSIVLAKITSLEMEDPA